MPAGHCTKEDDLVTYLDRILEQHREMSESDHRSVEGLLRSVQQMPPTRGFGDALRGRQGLAVIAEIKRRSPSKGDLFADLDPAAMAIAYESGGAGCLSDLAPAGVGIGQASVLPEIDRLRRGAPGLQTAGRRACGHAGFRDRRPS